ncbi:MAG: valine--tRNA ligase [Caldilineaceae bacterium]|nr:valine--tRNA ligase [Caldilineaceae bacterium]MDE0337216.1 valine--tRNA ligase [Caldilineaceae bacterium]
MTSTTPPQTREEMPKVYEPRQWEEKLYEWWEAEGFFRPEQQIESGLADPDAPSFVVSMPPPNVTGALHLGHAITSAVEDMLIRYNRMAGRPTLWVPGTDHAGIATQNVVERKLAESGATRHDLGRERFLQEVWAWKDEYHGQISGQQRRMGISCDWTRERFTLDDGLSDAVLEAFIRLYEDDLIYRGNYLVNWCPRCESAISDLEVEHEPVDGRLYTFRYPLRSASAADSPTSHVEVSTTRPETILGDTAVAVHPDDERYAHLIGKTALVPILEREIPVIADDHVDPKFGTGALKVTPGHDPNDYLIGQRHNLPHVNITNEDGTLNAAAGPYEGLDRFEAREKLWQDMDAVGLVVDDKPHVHEVGHCQRCHTIVEPLLSTQWFVKAKPLAEAAVSAVKDGRIKIVPERFERNYYHWMENIRDWCISRQLWWGHRIPIWYGPDGHQFAARNESEALEQAIERYGETVKLEQDEDVLDTWFSSALWPFSTLGWPQIEENEASSGADGSGSSPLMPHSSDLSRFYPTTVLETGYDILFFWVARMIMMGLYFTGKVPFHYVYLHGLVRAEDGRKMSKSLGNALDPLDLIGTYGNDALRFTLLTGSTPGNDMKLSVTRIEANRNFANKIWNAARFVLMNLEVDDVALSKGNGIHSTTYALPAREAQTLADRWILSRLNAVQTHVTQLIENWQLGEAGRQLYEFLWSEYCDWYIEAAKPRLYGGDAAQAAASRQVLAYTLEQSLRLLHPFMPYVTEAIWSHLPGVPDQAESLMTQRWSTPAENRDASAEDDFGSIQEIVRAIRNARAEYNVEPGRRIAAVFAGSGHSLAQDNLELFTTLARLDESQVTVEASANGADSGPAVQLSAGGITTYLPLAGMVDLENERKRLQKELDNVDNQINRTTGLLSNENFVGKAPEQVVQRERDKLEDLNAQRAQVASSLEQLAN